MLHLLLQRRLDLLQVVVQTHFRNAPCSCWGTDTKATTRATWSNRMYPTTTRHLTSCPQAVCGGVTTSSLLLLRQLPEAAYRDRSLMPTLPGGGAIVAISC